MVRIVLRTTLALFLFSLLLSAPTRAQTETRNVTVSGHGSIQVEPDQATVRFGVVTIDLDPEEARTQNASVAATTLNALRNLGIEERKIQVNTLRIQPYSEYDPDQRRNVDRGFQAVREMTIVLDDLDLLPTAIARIVGEGANRINGISYGVQDEQKAEQEALVEALKNARTKAELMAETVGTRLGVVLRITEQGVVRPQPVMFQVERALTMKDAAGEANPDAYAAGEIEVAADVTIVYALLPPRNR